MITDLMKRMRDSLAAGGGAGGDGRRDPNFNPHHMVATSSESESDTASSAEGSWLDDFVAEHEERVPLLVVPLAFLHDRFSLQCIASEARVTREQFSKWVRVMQHKMRVIDVRSVDLDVGARCYYAIHQRYVNSVQGSHQLWEAVSLRAFGSCPLKGCGSPLCPVSVGPHYKGEYGLSPTHSERSSQYGVAEAPDYDTVETHGCKLFCSRCCEAYHPPCADPTPGMAYGAHSSTMMLLENINKKQQ